MNPRICLLISLFLVFHNANAFNITKILSEHPMFSTFNDLLTKTNLASEINSRETITVLVVPNSNISPLSEKSAAIQKNILSVHIILDYYDAAKLKQLKNGSTTLTTLFQSTGLARGQQGFLNVSQPSDHIMFGSAMPGAGQEAVLVESVASEPYNISVLQVTTVITPPGIDSPANTTSPPTAKNSTSPSPSSSPKSSPTPPTSSPSDPPSDAEAPAGTTTPAAAPTGAPTSDAPIADSPSGLAAAADAPGANAGKSLQVGLSFVSMMVFASALFA